MSIDNGEIIRRLRAIAATADEGFRRLCASAGICSNCMNEWDSDGECSCTTAARGDTK